MLRSMWMLNSWDRQPVVHDDDAGEVALNPRTHQIRRNFIFNRNSGNYHNFNHKAAKSVIELADKLKQMAPVPMSKVFFANSGSEANDTAIKMIWYYNNARGRPNKKKIISRQRAYHGVTIATASLTGLPVPTWGWKSKGKLNGHTQKRRAPRRALCGERTRRHTRHAAYARAAQSRAQRHK